LVVWLELRARRVGSERDAGPDPAPPDHIAHGAEAQDHHGPGRRFRHGRAPATTRAAEIAAAVKPWREAVRSGAALALNATNTLPLRGPVAVTVTFFLPRPKAHYGAKGLKASAPVTCAKRPDVDKLLRSTLDALTSAGVYGDDSQVVHLTVWKMYSDPSPVGAVITVRPLP
jgi:Holliday junction resolvase RusA-like endonuclease